MVPANEAGGWGLWEEKPGIYLKMSIPLELKLIYPLDPAMLHSLQQGAPTSRKQEDLLKTEEIWPSDSAVGFVLSEVP